MPPIWKIKNKPFWLVGTVHYLREEDYPISDVLQGVINDTRLLVLEDKDFLVKGQHIGVYEDGRTILSELSPKTIDFLKERCDDVGLDFAQVQAFRPWKVSFAVVDRVCNSIGFSGNNGLDKYLLETFSSSKSRIISLEDSLEVLLALDRFPLEDQERMLLSSLQSIELIVKQIEGLYEGWKLGSEELIVQFAHEPLKVISRFFQQFILERNTTWLPKVKKLIEEEDSVLVAVGAAHLFGEYNIIDSLISVGYEVERLT